MCVSGCVLDAMGALLSWVSTRVGALLLDGAEALKTWRAQDAIEDSPQRSEGLDLEEGDLGADSWDWCERSVGGGDTSDEYFDSRSWYSDALSDLSPDREDAVDALLGLEDTRVGQRVSGCRCHGGQSRTWRRESPSAKDHNTDVPETYDGLTGCKRRKSPDNKRTDVPLKLSTSNVCSIKILPHASAEELNLDLEQEQDQDRFILPGETEVSCCSELNSSHVQIQHNTDTFGPKVNTPKDTQDVRFQTQSEGSSPTSDPQTCAVQVPVDHNWVRTEKQKSTHELKSRFQIDDETKRYISEWCHIQDVDVGNVGVLSTFPQTQNTGSHTRDCNGRSPSEGDRLRQRGISNDSDEQTIEDNRDSYRTLVDQSKFSESHENLKCICTDNAFRAHTYTTDVRTAQKCDICKTEHSTLDRKRTDAQVITGTVVASSNVPESHDTRTVNASHNTNPELRDAHNAQIKVSEQNVDICCSQVPCEESSDGVVSEFHPQVCTGVTKPVDKAWVSGVCFQAEQRGGVSTVTERTNAPGTVHEICSSLTFSAGTALSLPLDACSNRQHFSVPLAGPDDEGLNERSMNLNQPLSAAESQTQDLVPSHVDKGDATIAIPFQKQLEPEHTLSDRSHLDSGYSQTQCDTGRKYEECLPFHLLLKNPPFSSSSPEEQEPCPLLSDKEGGGRGRGRGRGRAGSAHSLQNKEGSHVCSDRKEEVGPVSEASLALSQLGKRHVSEHSGFISKTLTSDYDVPSEIASTMSYSGDAIRVQGSSRDHPGNAQWLIFPINTRCSPCNPVQLPPKIPEDLSALKAPSLPSDSNNNTKTRVKEERGGGGCSEPLKNVKNPSGKEGSELVLTSLESNRSSENCVGSRLEKDVHRKCHLNLADVNEPGRKSHERLGSSLDVVLVSQQIVDEIEVNGKSCLPQPLEEHTLTEQSTEQVDQPELRILRYSHPDVVVSLLAVSSLEPILEAENSQENFGTADVGTVKEHEIMVPAEEMKDSISLSGDPSNLTSPDQHCEPEKEPFHEVNPLLRGGSQRCCRPKTVAYDAVFYSSVGSSCIDPDDPQFDGSPRNANFDKMSKKSKNKSSQTGSKVSKFSVFSKMPSFRKAKGSKCSKSEEESPEFPEKRVSSPQSDQGSQGENSDDDVFIKADFLRQTPPQAEHYDADEEGNSFSRTTPCTHHVKQLVSQGSSGEGAEEPSLDPPLLLQRQVHSPNGHNYKRSRSNDSLNLRMRFAQAHKSLSSLFETRYIDKDHEQQGIVGIEGDCGKAKQPWRKLKRSKEAELLKRTLSVPEGECGSNAASGQDHVDFLPSPVLDQLSNPGSPSALRALRHTDPISKRGVPQSSGQENLLECKSEGQRRKCSSSGLPVTPFSDAFPPFHHSSPVSPSSPHQPFPLWSRSHSVAEEGLTTESPIRPMSPKPNSPRPAAQRKLFRLCQSSRASSVPPILLGQSVSAEGLTDPPERPKTLKPSASPLGLSLSPVEGGDWGRESQSHISLSELEVRKDLVLMSTSALLKHKQRLADLTPV
ncbi:uncharacterized protein LOC115416672 isoform X2 [Sphaeramia orbicularis]|uniref:uncharacterized protein LOC115416672 isoform X2 n=1 Tax=Sphaeramia orbicularis TaxID=375764 RepID=UPI0011810ABC|nr:uncharacterized protein LOC115416672 isoform X2 [Sphaeramia orbicularis]